MNDSTLLCNFGFSSNQSDKGGFMKALSQLHKAIFVILAFLFFQFFPVEPSAGPIRKWLQKENEPPGKAVQLFSVRHNGHERQYYVHVPSSYNSKNPTPVILVFHGGGGNALNAMKSTQMNQTSEKYGFLAVYPQGLGPKRRGKIIGTWNADRCCGTAEKNQTDDVGFTSAMIDDLAKHFNVDTRRIFATGHSNGALFSYKLACELSDRIAAIAPNSGQDSLNSCRPQRPIAIIHFHGTADQSAKYEGGHCGGRLGDDGWDCVSVPEYVDQWRKLDGCSDEKRVVYRKGAATCVSYDACSNGVEVVLCTIEGAGHTWPGGEYDRDGLLWKKLVGPLSHDISANEAMWKFFKKHPMPKRN